MDLAGNAWQIRSETLDGFSRKGLTDSVGNTLHSQPERPGRFGRKHLMDSAGNVWRIRPVTFVPISLVFHRKFYQKGPLSGLLFYARVRRRSFRDAIPREMGNRKGSGPIAFFEQAC